MGATPYRCAEPRSSEPPPARSEVTEEDEEDVVALVEGDHVSWVPVPLWRKIIGGTLQVIIGGATTMGATRELRASGLVIGVGVCALLAWQFRVLCLPPRR